MLQINTNEIKNDIMKKNKTLSEIFPINPKVFIGIVTAIKWMTLIIFICNFFMLCIKEWLLSKNKNLFKYELNVSFILVILENTLLIMGSKSIKKYENFLGCGNVNKNQFQKYKGMDDLYSLYGLVIFYIFYLSSYFSFIIFFYYVILIIYDYDVILFC